MLNVTHQLVGASAALVGAQAAQACPLESGAAVAAAVMGSWLPDVDLPVARVHRRSRLERRSLAVGALGALLRLPVRGLALLVRHRGVTHSLAACVAVAAVAWGLALTVGGLAPAVAAGVVLGYVAHVGADALTPAGVRLWWPFTTRSVWLAPRRLRVRTGSLAELVVAASAAAVTAVALL